ncbi:MAG: hypothetical protein GQ569_03500 [Methylococcaceae bacterium]|nr:hypothetical protein [Methylococcaceae bacterium]
MQTISLHSTAAHSNKAKLNQFNELLEPFGDDAADFFLAASLYHAHKVSFAKAAELASLSFEEFNYRLKEHFGIGYIFDDSAILEDLETLKSI